jgi:hypothetical protein
MHTTHTPSDCCKYEKDAIHKNGFRKDQCNSTAPDKKTTCAYTQLSATIMKLEKVSKKLKKSSKKCKNEYNSDSNDSDSS